MDLQELITRGRFVFSGAQQRLKVFGLVNGKRNTMQIAKLVRRHVNNVRRDLTMMSDAGLIQQRMKNGQPLDLDGFPVYEKVPLARTVPVAYFTGPSSTLGRSASMAKARPSSKGHAGKKPAALSLPSETEILDICRNGEDQTSEFKGQGTDFNKISREIAAMLNTQQGGRIFYGIDDEGTIQGANISRQKFDQGLQNSIRNTISPPATVRLNAVSVIGSEVLVVTVLPWNRKDVYHFEGRVLLRKGTNVFVAKPEESKKLHKGIYVI
jgi:hypothetical protein